ncbi:hypothetical protein HYY69_03660 [Candidatus Woesearchaeota archaeon]|nr:hypothetical protein [Candidatus Woesearchaeota archaeon]
MPTQLFATVLYSILVAVVSLLSNMYYFMYEHKAKAFLPYVVPFASGILLTSVYLYLLPMALILHLDALVITLFGFLGYYVLELFVQMNPCSIEFLQTKKGEKPSTMIKKPSCAGLFIHMFIQGIILGVAFDIGLRFGIVITFFLGILKIPESLATMQHYFQGKVLMKNLLLALLIPLVSIGTYFGVTHLNAGYNGMALALTGGMFMYLATTNLFKRVASKSAGLLFIIGIIVTMFIGQLL